MPAAPIARVLLDSPVPQLDRLLDYAIPDGLDGVAPGVRVRVPLGSGGKHRAGLVVELAERSDFAGELAALVSVVSPARVLTDEVWRLARRVADRAAGGANDVLRTWVPKRQARVEAAWLDAGGPDRRTTVDVALAPSAPDVDQLMDALAPGAGIALDAPPVPATLADGTTVGRWAVLLAAAAAAQVRAGRSAILVAPDHRDLDQLAAALAELVDGDDVARVDAGGGPAARYRAFLRCLEPRPVVVLGNRSAVGAPATDLGLIAIWDDGDPLLREQLSPRVHARDAALIRREHDGSALLIAAHARSADVQRLVEIGHLQGLRPAPFPRPAVAVGRGIGDEQRGERIPSSAWRAARTGLETGPVLVLVARPGYAPGLACARCGAACACRVCAGPLQRPSGGGAAACAWCGAIATDWRCPECDGTEMRMTARGSSRTAEELGRAFPGVRVVVSDGERAVLRVGSEPALVVATRGAEPIAAGGYRAVLLLDGARMLQAEGLRIAEECVRWWSNAAALAAPGAPVLLPGVSGRVANAVATWQSAAFAHDELEERRALHYPPAVRIAAVTGAHEAVERLVGELPPLPDGAVLGPVGTGDGERRAIVRFPYPAGAAVAAAVRAAVVREAAAGRRAPGAGPGRGRPRLVATFDDLESLA